MKNGKKDTSPSGEVTPGRIIMRLELTPAAVERFAEIAAERGMPRVNVTSRLVSWFAVQSPFVQSAVMGHYPNLPPSEVEQVILKGMMRKA